MIKHALIYGVSIGGAKAIGFLMIPVFTSFLDPADYGRLDNLQILADLLGIIAAMGMADALYRYGSGKDAKNVAANIYSMSLLITIVSMIILQGLAVNISYLLPDGITILQVRLILATISISGCILIPLSWLRMQDKAIKFFKVSMTRILIQAVLSLILLYAGFGVTGVMFAGFAASLYSAISLGIYFIKSTGIRIDISKWKSFIIYGSPLIITGIAGFVLGSFDRWILAGTIGPAAMAMYALAAKFGLLTSIAVQPFDMWWLPKRFSVLSENNGEEKCAKIVGIGFSMAVFMAVGVASCAPILIKIMTPDAYYGAINYVPFLCALAALHSITIMINHGCYNCEFTKYPMIIDSCSAITAFIGYMFLIPSLGAYGAIMATAIALSLRFIAMLYIGQKQTYIPYRLDKFAVIALIGIIFIFLIWSFDHALYQFAVGISGCIVIFISSIAIKLVPLPIK